MRINNVADKHFIRPSGVNETGHPIGKQDLLLHEDRSAALGEEEKLYQRYINGDEKAADTLVARYGDPLLLYIYGFVGNLQDAEDLMIESFALIFAKARPVNQKGSFKGYLFKIGRNLAGRHRKKRGLWPLRFEELSFEPKSEGLADTPLLLKERNLQLYKAMAKLKDDYREALYLVYFEEMSYRQAAAVMQKSENQITKLVYRGKQSLKSILEREGFEYADQ